MAQVAIMPSASAKERPAALEVSAPAGDIFPPKQEGWVVRGPTAWVLWPCGAVEVQG